MRWQQFVARQMFTRWLVMAPKAACKKGCQHDARLERISQTAGSRRKGVGST
jgi:hypothetical protein